jgi:NADH:ubiquinone oxidoreductase subunit E
MSTIENILLNYPTPDRSLLLPILQDVQSSEGYIPPDAVVLISDYLKIPTSKVYSVSAFYERFRFTPGAKYAIFLCNGTACHMEKSGSLIKEFEKQLGISAGQITRDKLFSLSTTPCMGACGKAPVVKVNNEFHTGVTIGQVAEMLNTIKNREEK